MSDLLWPFMTISTTIRTTWLGFHSIIMGRTGSIRKLTEAKLESCVCPMQIANERRLRTMIYVHFQKVSNTNYRLETAKKCGTNESIDRDQVDETTTMRCHAEWVRFPASFTFTFTTQPPCLDERSRNDSLRYLGCDSHCIASTLTDLQKNLGPYIIILAEAIINQCRRYLLRLAAVHIRIRKSKLLEWKRGNESW